MTQHSVCIIADDLTLPLDEGIKRFAHSVILSLSAERPVLGISVRSEGQIEAPGTIALRTNKLLLSYRLYAKLRQFKPHIIFYIPSASATIFSFIRSRVLKLYWRNARVIMISLQPRQYGRISRRLLSFLLPDMVLVQNEDMMKRLAELGCRTQLLPSGVDIEKFTQVSRERKTALRVKYGLNPDAFTVLHVGHLTRRRNVEFLMQVRRQQEAQVVLVGSSLPHEDRNELTARLRGEGIAVFDEYLPDVEELYQLSDCYLFPVFSEQACIGVPLSVLEAMACNLPVISVRYGNLPALFQEGQGLYFADTPQGLLDGIARTRESNGCHTREKVAPYSWQNIARNLLEQSRVNQGNTDGK